MTQISVNQVGKRWFICKAKGIEVEASYGHGIDWIKLPVGYDQKEVLRWNITGKGARRHKDEIVEAITSHMNGL